MFLFYYKQNNTADKLQKAAEKAKETATEAETAVKDAKQTLKQVRQAGRLKIREAKIKTKAEYTRATPSDTTKPVHRPFNRPTDTAPRDIGNSPGKPPSRPANAKSLSANPARSEIPSPKAGQAQSGTMPKKPQAVSPVKVDIPAHVPEAAPKRGLFRFGNTSGNGVSMKQIQEWLGHSDFGTTANIYAHLAFDSKLSSADALNLGTAFGRMGKISEESALQAATV
ncbi:hypothetical protein FACS1894208_05540 [Clostridia bacterium]|nr:hypothetical protein FACS1894208_05540 [Clostridia bacterium]